MAFPQDALTTAADSVLGQATWTATEYGSREVIAYIERVALMEFLEQTQLVDVRTGADIMEVYSSIEAGTNTAAWDTTEYQEPGAYIPAASYETRITPVRMDNRYTLSKHEQLTLQKGGGEQFARVQKLVKEKSVGCLDRLFGRVKAQFVTEVLNKFGDGTSNYLTPDGQPVLSATHAYSNGGAFNNIILGGGVAYDEAAADAIRAYEAAFKDSGNEDYDIQFDTIIVPMGSADEKAAWQLHEVPDVARPERYQDINIYRGEVNVVSIRGMLSGMWLAVDSRREKIVKFNYTSPVTADAPVHATNGAMSVSYFGFGEFGITELPVGVCGSV